MSFCSKCGARLNEGATFCSNCGAPQEVPAQQAWTPPEQQGWTSEQQGWSPEQQAWPPGQQAWSNEQQFHPQDIENNKVMAVLAYLGVLVFVPMFAAKESKFAHYHVNQGLVLFIAEVAYAILYAILSSILLAISWRLYVITRIIGLLSLVFLVLSILGIVNALNGKAKELPVIGKIKILK